MGLKTCGHSIFVHNSYRKNNHFVGTGIRHITITNCPFRFAFSHQPRRGQLLRQKHRNNFTWNWCASFLRFSDSSKQSQSVSLIYKLAWLAGTLKSEENLVKTSCKVAPVIKVAHIFWWRHDNRKQLASACDLWCDVSCDIPYSSIGPSMKTTKIGTPWNLSYPQYSRWFCLYSF